jgi:hypothetical protein
VLIASRIRGPLGPELLRPALDALQRKHPRLRSTIQGPDSELQFVDGSAGPIPLRVERADSEAGAHGVELDELNRPIDATSCLLRATLLLPAEPDAPRRLLLLAHHAMADGNSLVELVEDLARFCGLLHAGGELSDADVEPLELLPSVHDLLPDDLRDLRGRVGNWIHGRRTRARLRRFGARTLPVERLVPLRSRSSGAVRRRLDEEHVRRLRRRCEEDGASPHGVLCAALLFAVARRLPPGPGGIPLTCRSSVSLRQKLSRPVGRKDLGLLASFLISYHCIRPETTVRDVAGEVLEQLWEGYRNRDMFRGLGGNLRNTEAALQGGIPVTAFVTNLDEPRIDVDHGPFRIEEILGLPGGAAFPGVLGLASVTVNGRLGLGFFYSRPALGDDTVEAVADDVVRCIGRACDGDLRFEEFREP